MYWVVRALVAALVRVVRAIARALVRWIVLSLVPVIVFPLAGAVVRTQLVPASRGLAPVKKPDVAVLCCHRRFRTGTSWLEAA